MTPHAGMGFGQAIEDGLFSPSCSPAGQRRECAGKAWLYEALRLPHTSQVQEVTRRNAQFFHQIVPLRPGEERPDRINRCGIGRPTMRKPKPRKFLRTHATELEPTISASRASTTLSEKRTEELAWVHLKESECWILANIWPVRWSP